MVNLHYKNHSISIGHHQDATCIHFEHSQSLTAPCNSFLHGVVRDLRSASCTLLLVLLLSWLVIFSFFSSLTFSYSITCFSFSFSFNCMLEIIWITDSYVATHSQRILLMAGFLLLLEDHYCNFPIIIAITKISGGCGWSNRPGLQIEMCFSCVRMSRLQPLTHCTLYQGHCNFLVPLTGGFATCSAVSLTGGFEVYSREPT